MTLREWRTYRKMLSRHTRAGYKLTDAQRQHYRRQAHLRYMNDPCRCGEIRSDHAHVGHSSSVHCGKTGCGCKSFRRADRWALVRRIFRRVPQPGTERLMPLQRILYEDNLAARQERIAQRHHDEQTRSRRHA